MIPENKYFIVDRFKDNFKGKVVCIIQSTFQTSYLKYLDPSSN